MKAILLILFMITNSYSQVVGTGNNGGPDEKGSEVEKLLRDACIDSLTDGINFYRVEFRGKKVIENYTREDLKDYTKFLEIETVVKFLDIKTSLTDNKLPKCLDNNSKEKVSRYTLMSRYLQELKKLDCHKTDLNMGDLNQFEKLDQFITRLTVLGQLDEE